MWRLILVQRSRSALDVIALELTVTSAQSLSDMARELLQSVSIFVIEDQMSDATEAEAQFARSGSEGMAA